MSLGFYPLAPLCARYCQYCNPFSSFQAVADLRLTAHTALSYICGKSGTQQTHAGVCS